MEAQLVLTQALPYTNGADYWRENSAVPLEPDETAITTNLVERYLKWRVVQETAACFIAGNEEGSPYEEAQPTDKSLYEWYVFLKEAQRKKRGEEVVYIKISDQTVAQYLVTIFLAAVHATADRSMGSEPADCPYVRFRLDAYGRAMFREMTWMLDLGNTIETVKCSQIVDIVRWYSKLEHD